MLKMQDPPLWKGELFLNKFCWKKIWLCKLRIEALIHLNIYFKILSTKDHIYSFEHFI
jgi:hypothetical protein